MVDPHTNESRLFAFIDMATREDLERAMAKLHRSELDGRTINVEKVHLACLYTWLCTITAV